MVSCRLDAHPLSGPSRVQRLSDGHTYRLRRHRNKGPGRLVLPPTMRHGDGDTAGEVMPPGRTGEGHRNIVNQVEVHRDTHGATAASTLEVQQHDAADTPPQPRPEHRP